MDRVTGQTLWVRHQVQLCMGHYAATDDDDYKKSAEVARSITHKKFKIIFVIGFPSDNVYCQLYVLHTELHMRTTDHLCSLVRFSRRRYRLKSAEKVRQLILVFYIP